jgi:hypothetical protein
MYASAAEEDDDELAEPADEPAESIGEDEGELAPPPEGRRGRHTHAGLLDVST